MLLSVSISTTHKWCLEPLRHFFNVAVGVGRHKLPYELTWEKRGIVKRFWGHLSSAEFLAAHRAITEDPCLDCHIMYVISDFTGLVSIDVSPDTLSNYSIEKTGAASYLPNIRGAMVANNLAGQEMCALITAPQYVTPYEMRQFTSMNEARTWLGC